MINTYLKLFNLYYILFLFHLNSYFIMHNSHKSAYYYIIQYNSINYLLRFFTNVQNKIKNL